MLPGRYRSSPRESRNSINRSRSISASRVSPNPCSIRIWRIRSIDREAEPAEKLCALMQRQADNIAVRAVEGAYESGCAALNGVAARLAHPFATIEIGADPPLRQTLEGNKGPHHTGGAPSIGGEDNDSAQHPMTPP